MGGYASFYRSMKERPVILSEWVGRHIWEVRTKKEHARGFFTLCIQQAVGKKEDKGQNAGVSCISYQEQHQMYSEVVSIAIRKSLFHTQEHL